MGEAKNRIIEAEMAGNTDYPFPSCPDGEQWPSEQEMRDDEDYE